LNFETGEIAASVAFEDFDNGPWINLTLGGYGIFNGSGVRPIATGDTPYDPDSLTNYYLNIAEGTIIDDASAFVADGFASQYHIGTEGDIGKFVPGETGILGFEFTTTKPRPRRGSRRARFRSLPPWPCWRRGWASCFAVVAASFVSLFSWRLGPVMVGFCRAVNCRTLWDARSAPATHHFSF